MKLRTLFMINFFIALFFGLGCAIFAVPLIQLYGLAANEAAIWTTRLVGGSILGFSALMWFGANTASAEARRVIAFALFVQDIVGLVASMEIQLGGNINVLGWSNPILYLLLALGYGYFAFIAKEENR